LKLDELIKQSRTNHYKMLVIVDNNKQQGKIIDTLKSDGWEAYDVTKSIVDISKGIPEAKLKLRIGEEIKKWVKTLPDKVIFYNTNILYSPELGRLSPIGAFKYKSRDREIILFVEGHASGNRIRYSTYDREDYAEMDVGELIHIRMEDLNA
jgi:hypothetical protein